MLHMVELALRQAGGEVLFVSLGGTSRPEEAVTAIYRAASASGWVAQPADGLFERLLEGRDPFAINDAVATLAAAPSGATFFLDDVTAEVGRVLFGRLRDALWELDRTWAVAAGSSQAAGLLVPPADAFFDRRIDLKPLDVEERVAALTLREDPDASEASSLARLVTEEDIVSGNPRDLIAVAQEVGDAMDASPESMRQGAERRLHEAERVVGPAARALLRELDALGPVSAGDDELLAAMGWSRPRAVEILNRLSDEGVLRAYAEPANGPGRPRKLYVARRPLDFAPGG